MKTKEIKKEFISPSVAYRGKPFWSWNGELRAEELLRQTDVLKEMGMGGYFMHSRTGLGTEYLGEEWFDLINQVADKAERDGMEAWLYDEDRWPSGSAGGKVTEDPQYRMKSLYVYETAPELAEWNEKTVGLYLGVVEAAKLWEYRKLEVSAGDDVHAAVQAMLDSLSENCRDLPGEWKALRFDIVSDVPNSNYNGNTYIDTMSRKATDKFIEMTHEEYAKHCGDRLGKSIKGIFTDEPHRGRCLDNLKENEGVRTCAFFYTDDIFEEFEKRYGYAIRDRLPELFYRVNGEQVSRIRLHYIDLGDNLFLERFAKPLNDWCNDHGILFTGHVLHEDSLTCQTMPHGSLMRFYEYMGYPGVDCLTEHNRCYWIVKQIASAARQLGQKWMLSELYGCTGWQFNFKSHKAVGDWQALFGINLRCHHLSWYTMEGEAKRDYPASILHQSPWYHDYDHVESYFARFGLVMSEGEADCGLLVLNPIESVWCLTYPGWTKGLANQSPEVAEYERRYAQLFHMLIGNHIDFDYGEEQMMAAHAFVDKDEEGNAVLRVGKASYRTVLVTNMLTVRPSTMRLLAAFAEAGGKLVFAGELPAYVDGTASKVPAILAKEGVCVPFEEEALIAALADVKVMSVEADGQTAKDVFIQTRKGFGGKGYAAVVLNTDRNNGKDRLTLTLNNIPNGMVAEEWNLETGERCRLAVKREAGSVMLDFSLEAAGTRCFVLLPAEESESELCEAPVYETIATHTLSGEFDYTADEQNVCVLDWVKWRFADGEWQEETEVLRADRAIRAFIGIERRSGAMLQPWFAKQFDKKAYGPLQLEYEFFVDRLPEGEVFLAGERPDLNSYKLNGVALTSGDINDFWIDECFKRMPVPAGALQLGRNTVTIDVTFMRTTNVEAVYLVGGFGVSAEGKKRTLVALPEKIGCDNYAAYGLPFYSGNMTYHIPAARYQALLGELDADSRILLTPDSFTGGCAKVTALGKSTVLAWDPYEADVTEAVKAGADIEVMIEGTRVNLFGPLHEIPKPAGACGPENFVTGGPQWTDDYSLMPSGLRGVTFKLCKVKA